MANYLEFITPRAAMEERAAILEEFGMTHDELEDAAINYELNLEQRARANHYESLGFLLGEKPFACCRSCKEVSL